MFYMRRHVQATYVICMEAHRVPGKHPYHITNNFSIVENMMPLSKFELQFSSDVVHNVFEFQVEGKGGDCGGVCLRPALVVVLERPFKTSSTRKREARDEDEAEDSCEDLGDELESDLERDEPVVDTDVASFDESGLSGDSTDELTEEEAKKPATKGVGPATGGNGPATGGDRPAKGSTRGPIIFDNGYFLIRDHEQYMIIQIHPRWCILPPHGLGRTPTMTKTITPGAERTGREHRCS